LGGGIWLQYQKSIFLYFCHIIYYCIASERVKIISYLKKLKSYLHHHSASQQDDKPIKHLLQTTINATKLQMADAMVDQRQREEQATTTTARGQSSKQSVNTAIIPTASGRARLQTRNTAIKTWTDVRPVLLEWLANNDQLFKTLEDKTGFQREIVSFGAFWVY